MSTLIKRSVAPTPRHRRSASHDGLTDSERRALAKSFREGVGAKTKVDAAEEARMLEMLANAERR